MTPPTTSLRRCCALAAAALAAALAGCAGTPLAAGDAAAPVAAATPAAPTSSAARRADGPTPGALILSRDGQRQPELVPAPPLEGEPATVSDATRADAAAADNDLWVRVRGGFTMAELDDDYVRKWEQWYATRPDYVQRMAERGGRYLFHVIEEVERRGLPTELALLPFIESAFNPQALSSARAAGMWQFMPMTGRDFELKQNLFRDDRRDVLASTRAALDYLQRLYGQFGDWHLALAAYNWGQGNVQRAIARNLKAGKPTDYASLKMPAETRNYVPKLQAVKNLVLRPEAYSITLPALQNHPFFLSVPIERDIDVALAARLAGLSLEEFQALNPQMNKPVILAAATPRVLLPYDNANHFVERLKEHRGPLATWTAWVAPRTLKPAEAARQVGMPEAQLREVNRIPPRMLVKVGSTLLVLRAAHATENVKEHVAENAMMVLAPEARPLRKLTLKAGRGDTVATVARRYKVSAAQVAQWNDVGPRASFKPGQKIVVMVASGPAKAKRPAAKTASAKVKAKAPAAKTRTAASKAKASTSSNAKKPR
ncbi:MULTISPECIES: transglycosylase SLT domain-containing protein [unclassified Rubrivivax]|uniref:transglycosylase SLT domain-containing protein n=1 Tax=unclassified Rubrivivax TaxID=2649762 RepID=UPI001E5CD20F|nr:MULTISPECIES: transglycosylase SLT domain-containing protein [unclassified Rubrivivax]MCC9598044.1 transglycosylase SLT domain-containing protein [Rubrivivax sp. JA1055]MCC9645699.1 transglycosylase SLT domain-containing protein [Rubrivivax sp. JA1029]